MASAYFTQSCHLFHRKVATCFRQSCHPTERSDAVCPDLTIRIGILLWRITRWVSGFDSRSVGDAPAERPRRNVSFMLSSAMRFHLAIMLG